MKCNEIRDIGATIIRDSILFHPGYSQDELSEGKLSCDYLAAIICTLVMCKTLNLISEDTSQELNLCPQAGQ